jgi:hypothetical protein
MNVKAVVVAYNRPELAYVTITGIPDGRIISGAVWGNHPIVKVDMRTAVDQIISGLCPSKGMTDPIN